MHPENHHSKEETTLSTSLSGQSLQRLYASTSPGFRKEIGLSVELCLVDDMLSLTPWNFFFHPRPAGARALSTLEFGDDPAKPCPGTNPT